MANVVLLPRFVGGAPVEVPPMIGVPLALFLMTTSWGMGSIQYVVSEVCFTTWYLDFEAAQTRDAVVERIGRMTVLCPRATHVGVVPRDIVVGV